MASIQPLKDLVYQRAPEAKTHRIRADRTGIVVYFGERKHNAPSLITEAIETGYELRDLSVAGGDLIVELCLADAQGGER